MHIFDPEQLAGRANTAVDKFLEANAHQERFALRSGGVVFHPLDEPDDFWCIDPNMSATREPCPACGQAVVTLHHIDR